MSKVDMNEDAIIQQDALARIRKLFPVIERRYEDLRALMVRASAGDDVPGWAIELARADLAAALDVAFPSDDDVDSE